jgi:hypothetical protein
MNIEKKYNLNFIKSSSWQEVFGLWRKNEAHLKKWEKHYKERGYYSWEEWRKRSASYFNCDKLEWSLYKINNPVKTVPKFFGGPFAVWRDYFYNGKKTKSFAQLTQLKKIQEHKGIIDIAKKFPKKTSLIGLVFRGKIFIIEGMHRSTAIGLINKNKDKLKSDIVIALAKFNKKELPELKRVDPIK